MDSFTVTSDLVARLREMQKFYAPNAPTRD